MNIIIELLLSIPSSIWSVAFGSLLTLAGVIITNRSNTKRLEIQLEHDKSVKATERKFAMRSDVYLNAAEELVRVNIYLGSLFQVDLSKENIGNALQGFFTSFAKLGLVAEEDTRNALNDLVNAYSSLAMKLMLKIVPISDHKTQIEILNAHHDETQVEIKRILALMRHHNESGIQDISIFKTLDSSFKFHQQTSKKLCDERNQHWDKVNQYTKEFIFQLADEFIEINKLQIPVMVGIRKELEVETDIQQYEKQLTQSTEQFQKQLESFLKSLDLKA